MRTSSRSAFLALLTLAACQPASPAQSPAPATAAPLPTCPPAATVTIVADDPPPALIRDAPPGSDAAIYTPSTEQQAIAARLAGSIVVAGHAFDYLRDLSDTYGPRMTGSPSYARAAAWAAESFKRAGVDSVAFEEVPIAAGWERHEAAARIVAPFDRPLHVIAGAWSTPTPAEGIKGEVVAVKDLSTEAIRAQSYALRGKIALADRSAFMKNDKVSWRNIVHAADDLKAAGALALFVFGSREGQAMAVSGGGTIDHMVSALPRATIGREDGLFLQRLVEKGPTTITFTNTSPITGPAKVPNIVAEIRGREKPDEWVLVGAHFDSWDLGTGAQDNGSGAAQVMEAARAIHALGTPPRRSIRFALYCGEEQGLHGSHSYAATHAKELDKAVFVLNADYGAGAPKGWNLNGRDDEKKQLQPLANALLAGLGGDTLGTKMRCDTDDCSFMVRGVPTANLDVDNSKYNDIHHLAADTFDKVSRASLDAGAAVIAVTAYAIADAPARLAARIDRGAVKAHLDKAELFDEVDVAGLWK